MKHKCHILPFVCYGLFCCLDSLLSLCLCLCFVLLSLCQKWSEISKERRKKQSWIFAGTQKKVNRLSFTYETPMNAIVARNPRSMNTKELVIACESILPSDSLFSFFINVYLCYFLPFIRSSFCCVFVYFVCLFQCSSIQAKWNLISSQSPYAFDGF